MPDLWNPFDPDNPVYKDLQKKTAVNRKTWRIIGSISVLYLATNWYGKYRYEKSFDGFVNNNIY